MGDLLKGISILAAVFFMLLCFEDRISAATGESGILLGSHPRAVAINNETGIAVAVNAKGDSVSVVDIASRTVRCTIAAGTASEGVAMDSRWNLAVVTNSHDGTAAIIDLSSCAVASTVAVGKDPRGIAVDQMRHSAFVANHKDDTVSVIDLGDARVTRTFAVGGGPIDIAIDKALNIVLAVNEKDSTVSIIDLNTYDLKGTLAVGQKPKAVDINPETHLAVIANEKDNSITVIDLQTWAWRETAVCKHPVDVVINPLDNRALVVCDEDRSLLLLDLATNTLVRGFGLNKLPKGIAVDSFTNIVAVTDDKTDSLTLIQLPNPVPETAFIHPAEIFRGSSGERITIEGQNFLRSSRAYLGSQPLDTIFLDNYHLEAHIPAEMLLQTGDSEVSVFNPSPDGGGSNGTDIQVINPLPAISVLDPMEVKAGQERQRLTIYGSGFFDDTGIYFGNTKKIATFLSPTKLEIELTEEDMEIPGEYEIRLYNLPPGGGNSNKVSLSIKPFFDMEITSPSDGSTINKAKTMVQGTIRAYTKDIGIRVNGVSAEMRGNEWVANNVPLSAGQNTLTAAVTDSYGNTATKSIGIHTNDRAQPVELRANITSGLTPLATYFSVSTELSNAAVSYQVDYEGDGIVDYTGETFENMTHTYASEGIFYPIVTVTDDQGNTYSDTIAITVLNKAEIDSVLKKKWEGMKKGLLSQDIERTVAYFLGRTQERYRAIFTKIKSALPAVAVNMNQIQFISMTNRMAEYRITRSEVVGEVTYYIYFVKDENGLWKIQQF